MPKFKIRLTSSYTLIEGLLTTAILAMVMVAMTPFIRTIYDSWNFGDRKTEIQQNARVGMEVMARLLRQAKRITVIPASGSGNFVEFRDALDNTTVVFFHNVASSPYYVGDAGLIKVGDLAMRTIVGNQTTNSLLAKSLNNLTLIFRDKSGNITSAANRASSIDISMELYDSQGLISNKVNISSSVTRRSEEKTKPTWAGFETKLFEVSTQTWLKQQVLRPQSISINSNTGEFWVADTFNNRIMKFSSDGTLLFTKGGLNQPYSVSVNSSSGECWVADTFNNRIIKYSSDGEPLIQPGGVTRTPYSVSVNSSTGECWVAETGSNMILKLSATGGGLLGLKGFNTPMSVSVNSSTGECWVAETGSNMVIKLSPGGDGLFAVKGFKNVTSVSVNSSTGECWAVDTGGIGEAPIQRVKKISPAGSVLVDKKITGCKLISADSSTGGCWVYVSSPSKILELDTDGNVVNSLTVSGHGTAYSIATSQEP